MSTAVVVRTPWQFGDRSLTEENKNGVVLPKVPVVHPMSRLGDANELSLRGSCVSVSSADSSSRSRIRESESPARASASPRISFVQEPEPFLPSIPNGVEVKVADDRSKVHMPVFGNNTSLSSRIENRLAAIPARAADGKTRHGENLTVSQIEKALREKMKTSYFSVKNLFQSYDPENRGKVTREQLLRILTTSLATRISLSQFNRLMKTLGLDKKYITFEEFHQFFKAKKEAASEYPSWFFQDNGEVNCTASKVHTYLKQEASKNSNDLLLSLNILADENIIKPEFQKALKKIGYEIGPTEYEKLWRKYDENGIGVVEVKKFIEKLTRKQKPGDNAGEKKKRDKDFLREQSINIERWLIKKFREGFHEMQHAFKELEVDGLVTRDQFLRVLMEYGLFLKDSQLGIFLERCGVPNGPKIDYKSFLTMFQNRGAGGVPSKILHNQHHSYHRAKSVDNQSCITNVSDIEGILMDMFHADFLKLLNKFHKIDHRGSGVVSVIEFRACLESYFGIELVDAHFTELMRSVPKDENGNVNYQDFLARFDSNSSRTIFDSVSSIGDVDDQCYFGRPLSTYSFNTSQSMYSPDVESGERDVTLLSAMIKDKLREDFHAIEEAFYQLDEKNTKRMNQEMFHKILKIAVADITSQETDTLWKHIITNQAGILEFTQFVRHFGFSLKSAVYPNSKRNPPVKGDKDFCITSHRFNSSKELVEDLVKSAIKQRYDEIWKIFEDMDKTGSNYVNEEQFKNVLKILCGDLTTDEQTMLTEKYSSGKWIPWKKFMMKLSPHNVMRTSTDVIVHYDSDSSS